MKLMASRLYVRVGCTCEDQLLAKHLVLADRQIQTRGRIDLGGSYMVA